MRRASLIAGIMCWAGFHAAAAAPGHDVVIANARIIVGNGQVIDRGAVVVKDGRIASVSSGPPPKAARGRRIDASGMTVIAGYIDGHRHLIPLYGYGLPIPGRPPLTTPEDYLKTKAPSSMLELLESGVTTVQSGGDDSAAILKLKQMVETGQIKGPRIVSSAQVPTAQLKSEAEVRAAVDAAFKSGADSIAEVPYPFPQLTKPGAGQWPFSPSDQETKNLAAGLDEAKKVGIPFQVHAVSPQAAVAAVKLGARRLVHSSHYDWMTTDQAKEMAATGAIVATSAANPGPVFGVFNKDNKPTYRDGAAWPQGEIAMGEDRGKGVGYMVINARTFFDNGGELAYSSDTGYNATAGLNQELKTLNLVFSPQDMVKIIGPNSADFVNHGADRGTLEVGKLGDILILSGNPLDGYWNFLSPQVVIKGGEVVIDKRRKARPRAAH